MNVKQLYEYTARFLASQASYSCKHMRQNPWILGAGANSISIWLDKKGTDYRIEARIQSNESESEYEYAIESLEKYRVFKYARTKQKRPV